MTLISNAFTTLDTILAPITPAGVTGMQFLSVFLIVYAISILTLSRVHVLKDNKPSQLIIALFLAYFTSSSTFSVIFITKLFPGLGMVSMGIIAFLTILSMLTPGKELQKIKWAPIMVIIAMAFILLNVWSGMAESIQLQGILMPQLAQNEWFTLIFIGIFIGVILLVSFTGKGKGPENFGTRLIKMMRGDEEAWK